MSLDRAKSYTGITSTMLGHMKSIKMSGLGQRLGNTIAKLRKDEKDALERGMGGYLTRQYQPEASDIGAAAV